MKLESIAKVIKNPEGNKSNIRATPSLLEIPQGSEKGALSLPSAATRFDENNVDLNDTASAISTSTFAILVIFVYHHCPESSAQAKNSSAHSAPFSVPHEALKELHGSE